MQDPQPTPKDNAKEPTAKVPRFSTSAAMISHPDQDDEMQDPQPSPKDNAKEVKDKDRHLIKESAPGKSSQQSSMPGDGR